MKYSIGTTYEGKNLGYLKEVSQHVNHIEISPDSLAGKRNGRVAINPGSIQHLKWLEGETDIEILIHGVGCR